MRRVQSFEFLDQSWLPGRLRAAATRYLNAAYANTPFPALWAAILAHVLEQCRVDRIVDLGSGAGGPVQLVLAEQARLGHRPRVTLTDRIRCQGPQPIRTLLSVTGLSQYSPRMCPRSFRDYGPFSCRFTILLRQWRGQFCGTRSGSGRPFVSLRLRREPCQQLPRRF